MMCLEKEKKRSKTMSVFFWLNSQQFIWNSNHTTRLSKIVDINAIACHLQEEEEEEEEEEEDDDDDDDDITSLKEISSPLTNTSPPPPSPPLHQHYH